MRPRYGAHALAGVPLDMSWDAWDAWYGKERGGGWLIEWTRRNELRYGQKPSANRVGI